MERKQYVCDNKAAKAISDYYRGAPKAYVRTFGCQQSVNDGEKIKGVLLDIGCELVDAPGDANMIFFNTCAVREHAEQRVFGNVGALKALKAAMPGMLICICGCMTEQKGVVQHIKQSYPYVDLVLGVNAAATLPANVAAKLASRRKVLRAPEEDFDIYEDVPQVRENAIKAFLPIVYGCDNFCSYCIVPYVRGRERSREYSDIKAEFDALVAAGYKEITLLGQNVNSYGKGLEEKIDFSDLLARLAETPGDYKLRFMTSHPKDATRKLVDVIAANSHIAKHLHLPVQSGSNTVLSRMNRKYTKESYLSLVHYARETCPGITFSTDIMIGFPDETDEDFEETLALVEAVGFTQLFTFIYSRRDGTEAANLPDNMTHRDKTERMSRLLKLQEGIMEEKAKEWLGNTYEALVEGPARDGACMAARLDNNMLCEFTGGEDLTGKFVQVRITGYKGALLQGELVK